MKDWKPSPEAIDLLMKGQLAYARIESVGVRVDRARLDATIEKVQADIADLERELATDEVAKEWKKAYGDKTNFESNDQLADVVFNKLGFAAGDQTATGKRSVKKHVLEQIDHPFVRKYLRIKPMRNSLRTNLIGVRRELVERDGQWFVHPAHSLNMVVTYRPSSQQPNWRNFPKRNPEVAALVRPCFIPRKGRHFVEIDQGQIEVRVPAALTGDRNLRRYILDKSTDMHRDQSIEVFFLTKEEVSKAVRSQVKNNFVFASFYGSAYYNCARRLWDDVDVYRLATASGTPMRQHLRKHGVKERGDVTPGSEPRPGTFARHVRDCQRRLWERFSGYRDWRRKTTDDYQRDGGLRTPTGFVVTGPHSPTEIPNYPIQGSAFHAGCLWPVIRLLDLARKYKLRTLILGDIYDSIQSDVPGQEIQTWLDLSYDVMTRQVPKRFPWLGDIPLEVEAEVSPVGGSWYDCAEWVKGGGEWAPKK